MYYRGCAFPAWSLELLSSGQLDRFAKGVVVYYKEGDDFDKVQRLAAQREPANIAMTRCYDEDLLEKEFGWRRGAYAEGGRDFLMPNIAIYCRTPMRLPSGEQVNVHVINAIGYAFDSKEQPDYQYFFPLRGHPEKWAELVTRMKQVWRFIYECAKRKGLRRVYLADIGGGAFSGGLELHPSTSYGLLKQESLPAVQEEYPGIETLKLERVPDWCFTDEARPLLRTSLLVNAWDPWSMVGNANAGDVSLDGFFGRCTAMAVLCWPRTNPHLRFKPVAPPACGSGAAP